MPFTPHKISASGSMSSDERHALNQFYDNLDTGIAVVNASLDLIFINRWFQKKMLPEQRTAYESGQLTNLKMMFDGDVPGKISAAIQRTVQYNSVQIISQAFHHWLIPLPDNRFSDGKMRQTCILKPYYPISISTQKEGKSPTMPRASLVLIQIKNESDTVLRTQNLKTDQKIIQEKNRAMKRANDQLDKMNSELLRLNNQLKQREAYVKIKTKMEALGCMAGGIAHDFNNFLAIILGYTELAMDTTPRHAPIFELLDEIQTTSHNASHVVKQILHYCHPNYIQTKKRDLNLDRAIRDQLFLLNAILPSTIELTYHCNMPESPANIYAAPSQIRDILVNLVRNAVDAIHHNHSQKSFPQKIQNEASKETFFSRHEDYEAQSNTSSQGFIEIHLHRYNKDTHLSSAPVEYMAPDGDFWEQMGGANGKTYLQLTVKDNGQGIQSSNLDRIFDPYYTTKDVGEGSGFGLSTVHGLVKHLGGGIRVYSQWGRGSCFEMVLPLSND